MFSWLNWFKVDLKPFMFVNNLQEIYNENCVIDSDLDPTTHSDARAVSPTTSDPVESDPRFEALELELDAWDKIDFGCLDNDPFSLALYQQIETRLMGIGHTVKLIELLNASFNQVVQRRSLEVLPDKLINLNHTPIQVLTIGLWLTEGNSSQQYCQQTIQSGVIRINTALESTRSCYDQLIENRLLTDAHLGYYERNLQVLMNELCQLRESII